MSHDFIISVWLYSSHSTKFLILGCKEDKDCQGQKKNCDRTRGRCFSCNSDTDCKNRGSRKKNCNLENGMCYRGLL